VFRLVQRHTESDEWWVLNRTIKCKDDSNYTCFYKSHLEFCTAAWSLHYAKDKLLVEKVHWRFTRMIPCLNNILYENRLKELKFWSLTGVSSQMCRLDWIIQDYTWSIIVVTGYFLCIRYWQLNKTLIWGIVSFLRSSFTGGINWIVKQSVLLQSTVSRTDFKDYG